MENKKPLIAGIVVFVSITLLTQLLTYQQYLIYKRVEVENVLQEARTVSDKLKSSLSYSLSATKTLAFLIGKYGVPADFDSIASDILESNKYIDAVELTRGGVITHVYPLEGNEAAIGYNVLNDSLRSQEARKAIERRELFFAGPFELKQGGMSVVGRLPIFKDNSFWGFSAVLIKLSTLQKAAGIGANPNFIYQLSKRNPYSGVEEFFISGPPPEKDFFVSIEVPDGEWKLYVEHVNRSAVYAQVVPFFILGLLLSTTAGLFSWNYARQPEKLRARVTEVTTQMNALQRRATLSLERANRLYHFTSRINHLMVHLRDENILYAEVCRIAVEVGKFKLAWIGLIDESQRKIFPAGSSGDDLGYLKIITPIELDRDFEGPAMRMIRTGKYVCFNDIENDPVMKPWAEHALQRGYRSSILLPIRKFGKVIGSFNLYAPEPNSFDDAEIQLLLETSDNISFTLENFEDDDLHAQAEQQVQAEKVFSDSLINSLPGVFYLYDRQGKFVRWNKNFETVSGYSTEEVSQMHPLDFFHRDQKALLSERIDAVFKNGYAEVEADFYTKDNTRIHFFFNGKKINLNGIEYLIGMGLDITDRINAEAALIETTEEIRKLSTHLQNIREEERSRIALEIHDVLGQQLTALKMDATWIRKRCGDNDAMTERLTAMVSLIDDTIKTVRRISSELRPGILDDLGLIPALEWQCTEFSKNTGLECHFQSNKNDIEVDSNMAINIFRIYQEALTNIARHAQASQVQTTMLQQNGLIQLTIEDNGIGVDLNEVKNKKSLGLISMKERARLFKGEVMIEQRVPQGTVVTVKLPSAKTVKKSI
jgi:PAS domain S-box-containing protein